MRVLLAAIAASLVLAASASAASPDIVVSQVYGGGGNSGATLMPDYDSVHVNSEFAVQQSDHDPQVVRLRPN